MVVSVAEGEDAFIGDFSSFECELGVIEPLQSDDDGGANILRVYLI